MKTKKKHEDNAVDKTEDSSVEKIVVDATDDSEYSIIVNKIEGIPTNQVELSSKSNVLNFKGEDKMYCENIKPYEVMMEKGFNANFEHQLIQIGQALDFDIIGIGEGGAYSILDDVCRIVHDYGTVDMSFAKEAGSSEVAEIAIKFIRIIDLLKIPVYIEEEYEQGSLFGGYDVGSGIKVQDNSW